MALDIGLLNVLVSLGLADGAGAGLADDIGKAVKPAAEQAEKTLSSSISAGLSKAGKGLTAGVTAPILAIGGAAITAAMSVDGALDAIRVGTGATGAQFDTLTNDFEVLAKGTTGSFDRIAQVVSTLNTRLGLSGDALQVLGDQVLDLEQITGKAVDVDGISRLFATFDTAVGDQSKLLDNLFRVAQATGIEFDTLVGNVTENAAQFQELGFSVEEAAAFVGQLEKNGANTGAVLAGLKKSIAANVRGAADLEKIEEKRQKSLQGIENATLDLQVAEQKLAELRAARDEGKVVSDSSLLAAENNVKKLTAAIENEKKVVAQYSETLEQGAQASASTTANFYDETVNQIKQLLAAGDELGAQNLAAEIFGAKAFTNILQGIKDGTFDVENFAASIAAGGDTISGLADETGDFVEEYKKLKNNVTLALDPIAREFFPAISSAIQSLVPLVTKFSEAFGALSPETKKFIVFAAGIAAAVGPALLIFAKIVTAVGTISKAFGALNALLVANPWVLLAAAAIAAVVLIVKYWDEIVAFFQAVFGKIAEVGSAAWQVLTGNLQQSFEAVGEFFGNLITKIGDGFAAAGQAIGNFITGVGDVFASIGETIGNFITGVKDAIVGVAEAIGSIVKGVADIYAKLFTGIIDGFTLAFSIVRDRVKAVYDFFVDVFRRIQDFIRRIVDTIRNLPGALLGGVGSLFRAVIPGLADGGPMDANKPYLVGERGPELVVPRRAGTVIPNEALGGLGGGVTYQITVNNPTAEPSSTSIPQALRRAAYLRG